MSVGVLHFVNCHNENRRGEWEYYVRDCVCVFV
jgi:hypothetical protein